MKLFKIKKIFKKSGDLRNIQIQKMELENLKNPEYESYILNSEKKYYAELMHAKRVFVFAQLPETLQFS